MTDWRGRHEAVVNILEGPKFAYLGSRPALEVGFVPLRGRLSSYLLHTDVAVTVHQSTDRRFGRAGDE